jgi:zinc protease
MAYVSLRSLSDPKLLDPALALLAQLLHAPSFPEEGLNRKRQRTLVGLKQQAQLPGTVGSKAFYQALYPKHPYGAHPAGNEAGLLAITRQDLVDRHKRYYVGVNTVLALIGDLSRREARKLSEQLLSQLVRGKRPAPIPPVPMPEKSQERLIPFPSTQSHILTGMPGMKRQDPDYFPLYIGNYILGGGGLVSRLSTVIREKHGLSYSVYSYFHPMQEYGPFTMGLQTKNETRDQALTLLRKTLRDYIDRGPSEEELIAAKRHLTGGFPLRIDSNAKIVGYLAVIGFYDLPLTYLNDFISRVQAVSVDQIRDAFHRRVLPDKLVTVIVGGGRY